MTHDWRVNPVDCPARPDGADTCDTAEHARAIPERYARLAGQPIATVERREGRA
jgi:hypothetical protein